MMYLLHFVEITTSLLLFISPLRFTPFCSATHIDSKMGTFKDERDTFIIYCQAGLVSCVSNVYNIVNVFNQMVRIMRNNITKAVLLYKAHREYTCRCSTVWFIKLILFALLKIINDQQMLWLSYIIKFHSHNLWHNLISTHV